MRYVCLVSLTMLSLACCAPAAFADSAAPKIPAWCGEPDKAPACSYTITNKSCTVTIDRIHPVAPPTIYVKPACGVKVIVNNPYQLERLTLDWKSSTTVVPPDTFQTAFTALSANLGKVTILGAAHGANFLACEDAPGSCTDAAEISDAQARVETNVDALDPLAKVHAEIEQIKRALLPPPGGGDDPGQPWTDTRTWVDARVAAISAAVPNVQRFTSEQKNLAQDVDTLEAKANTPAEKRDVRVLTENQKVLAAKVALLASATDKLNALVTALKDLKLNESGIVGNSVITDRTPNDKNYQTQTWALDYSNKLLPIAKRVAADSLKTVGAAYLGSVADASDKQPVLTLTVQFQSPSRLEVSAGLMVPFMPYHSYAKGSDASGNAIIQASTTYAVVPIALVNYRFREWLTGQQSSALFLTGGVGVNSATTQVEFGAGFTYSYRAIAVSLLADIGRDTNLGGNLTPGGSLGAYTVVPTTTSWGVRPAAALSVRIPLGGGSSSAAGSSSASK